MKLVEIDSNPSRWKPSPSLLRHRRGEVIGVSNDVIDDEKRGPVYSSRIRLKEDHLNIKGERVALSPGMTVTAEVKTDQRRVLDYFLSPLQQHVQESLRER
jgi:hemolysin D